MKYEHTTELSSISATPFADDLLAIPYDQAANWYFTPNKGQSRPLRLFCFPYACGSAQIFRGWADHVPDYVELAAIQLPGRGSRLAEKPFADMSLAADIISAQIAETKPLNYAIFGHSMGALLAYEVTRRLETQYARAPLGLIVAGYKAPTVLRLGAKLHQGSDAEFIAKIRQLGATPEPILDDPEMMELLLPTFRADFAMAENYPFGTIMPPLLTPVIAFAGDMDSEASIQEVAAWRDTTQEVFELQIMQGGHFFIRDMEAEFLGALSKVLVRLADGHLHTRETHP